MTTPTKKLTDRSWRGYTLAELRARQSVIDTHITAQQQTLARQTRALGERRSMPNRSMLRKMINALSYADYAVLGVILSRRLSSLFAKLRRHSKT